MFALSLLVDVAWFVAPVIAPPAEPRPALDPLSLELALQRRSPIGAVESTIYLGWSNFDMTLQGSGKGDDSTDAWSLLATTWSPMYDSIRGGFEVGVMHAGFDYASDGDAKKHESVDFIQIGGRAGWDAGDATFVPYVRGGVAIDPFDSGLFGGDGHLGYYGAGGVEFHINRRWSVAVEFTHLFDKFGDDLTFDGLTLQLGYRY